MKILLVEDDAFKESMIRELLVTSFDNVELAVAKSVSSAVAHLSEDTYDKVILDMALPSHDRSRAAPSLQMPSGGLEVLYEIAFDHRDETVVIVTQYPEITLDNRRAVPLKNAGAVLSEIIGVDVKGVIHFDKAGVAWKSELIGALSVDG